MNDLKDLSHIIFCHTLYLLLHILLLPHHPPQFSLLVLQLLFDMIHPLPVFLDLPVALGQLSVELLNLRLVVVELEKL